MIADSIAEAKRRKDEVLFDAEHFFDGYKVNPSYALDCLKAAHAAGRSEEHTSELQSLMRISYAVFCLKKKKTTQNIYTHHTTEKSKNIKNTQRKVTDER